MASVVHSSSRGQNYDRLDADEYSMARMVDLEGDGGGPGVDITAAQKMTAAMSGSLLTSLLGAFHQGRATGHSQY